MVCSGNTENSGDRKPELARIDRRCGAGFRRLGSSWFRPLGLVLSIRSEADADNCERQGFFGTYSPEYLTNGWEEYQKLKRVYEVLGKPDNLGWADTPLPQGLSYDSRLSCLQLV